MRLRDVLERRQDARPGVAGATLERFGAVSEQVVREMAEGALRVTGATVALAVSGIAGPDGGTPGKPVGTVWFCAAARQGAAIDIIAEEKLFGGERAFVRSRSVQHALRLILRLDLPVQLEATSARGYAVRQPPRAPARRLFFALWATAEERRALSAAAAAAVGTSGGRAVPEENLHVTLAFLGQVPASAHRRARRTRAPRRHQRGTCGNSVGSAVREARLLARAADPVSP